MIQGNTRAGAMHNDRPANALLAAHVTLIAFATLAMVTILAGEFPVWMQGAYTAKVYALGWRYTGQLYVVLGLLAAMFHAAPRFGWARTIVMFAAASGVALASELLGTNFGIPFGAYHYTEMLGYRVNGDVPYVIPLSWAFMLYCCLAMCGRLLRSDASSRTAWLWAFVAGAMLTAWDVPLEVQMTSVNPPHWIWDLSRSPSWIPPFLSTGVFYGMPLSNWIGWLVTATLIARLMLAIVPPDRWRASVSPALLPIMLYAANGLMPIATTARHGLWGAVVAGVVLMGAPVFLASRARAATAS